MAKKSALIGVMGASTGTERYIPRPHTSAIGKENYTRPTQHSIDITFESAEFDAKAFDNADWCPTCTIGKTEAGGDVYFSSINKNVSLIHEYTGLLDILYTATDKDIIEINIDSPGGYITTATQICTAIKACKGLVYTHASGMCASAGSLIWSVGHHVSVGELANFMWHMSSHGGYDNSLGVANEANFQIDYVKEILLDISLKRGFITEEEVFKICDNPHEAVWVSASEMRQRILQNAA